MLRPDLAIRGGGLVINRYWMPGFNAFACIVLLENNKFDRRYESKAALWLCQLDNFDYKFGKNSL